MPNSIDKKWLDCGAQDLLARKNFNVYLRVFFALIFRILAYSTKVQASLTVAFKCQPRTICRT
jgi:hypothetical protein